MKTRFSKPVFTSTLVMVACIVFYSFQSKVNQTNVVTFFDAIKLKKIKSAQSSNGHFSGKSVVMKLVNLTATSLNLSIPAGTIFEPFNEGEQTLIVVKE